MEMTKPMINLFSINILEQGWLIENSAENDLCSHGLIYLKIGEQVISNGEESYGISESALALLRTTINDHDPQNSVAEKLIFHGCGLMLMSGCNIGINWTVRHFGEIVELANVIRYDGNGDTDIVNYPQLVVNLPLEEYKAEVKRFAYEAKRVFDGLFKKVKESEFYPNEYQLFWKEYLELLG